MVRKAAVALLRSQIPTRIRRMNAWQRGAAGRAVTADLSERRVSAGSCRLAALDADESRRRVIDPAGVQSGGRGFRRGSTLTLSNVPQASAGGPRKRGCHQWCAVSTTASTAPAIRRSAGCAALHGHRRLSRPDPGSRLRPPSRASQVASIARDSDGATIRSVSAGAREAAVGADRVPSLGKPMLDRALRVISDATCRTPRRIERVRHRWRVPGLRVAPNRKSSAGYPRLRMSRGTLPHLAR